eukprot:366205-Chlamydomonas_euryale.AAC.5
MHPTPPSPTHLDSAPPPHTPTWVEHQVGQVVASSRRDRVAADLPARGAAGPHSRRDHPGMEDVASVVQKHQRPHTRCATKRLPRPAQLLGHARWKLDTRVKPGLDLHAEHVLLQVWERCERVGVDRCAQLHARIESSLDLHAKHVLQQGRETCERLCLGKRVLTWGLK